MIAWAIETLIASTLLMLLVLAIRGPVRRAFGPDLAYALWALPALRMLLPPLPESWRQSAAAPLAQASDVVVAYIAEPLGMPASDPVGAAVSSAGPDLWLAVLVAWAVGAVAFIGYHYVTHSRFCARVRALAGSVRVVAAGNVEVIETGAASGPLAFGVWRKYVAFPRDFAERYDPLERDLALAHELGHHARGDLIANWAALVVLALHWFNPVAWRAFRAFRADQEMACDALVLSGRAADLRHAYGRAIVKSAHGGAVSAACHLHTVNELKGRLRMLTRHEKTSRTRLLAGGGALAALTLTALGVTASGTQAAERVRSGIESTTGVDIASLELPVPQAAPPAPPAPPAPEAPPAPHAAPAPAEPDVAMRKHRVVVVRKKDGEVVTSDFEDLGALSELKGLESLAALGALRDRPDLKDLKNMPSVVSNHCTGKDGKGSDLVIHSNEGGKRKVIICTNRIEARASAAGAAAAAGAERAAIARVDAGAMRARAEASALEGLRRARENVARADMEDARRAAALAGIDDAIRDLETRRK